jgi:monoamine oxidase
LVYEKPFWKELGLCGLTQSLKGPAVVTRDTSSGPPGSSELTVHAITCFIVGGPGRKWSALPAEERKIQVINQVSTTYGHPMAAHPTAIYEQEWIKEPFSQGAPSPVMPTGLMTAYGDQLRAPVGKLHFGGTETAYDWKGYMDGAITSGERAADEVVIALMDSKL